MEADSNGPNVVAVAAAVTAALAIYSPYHSFGLTALPDQTPQAATASAAVAQRLEAADKSSGTH